MFQNTTHLKHIETQTGCTISGIEGMEHGAFDYLMKPVDLHMLLEKIQQAYKKKSTQ